jgi:hypothetical protein
VRAKVRRRVAQSILVAALGVVASDSAFADEATCNALIAYQQAYCEGRNTPLPDGQAYGSYDAENDICTINGC